MMFLLSRLLSIKWTPLTVTASQYWRLDVWETGGWMMTVATQSWSSGSTLCGYSHHPVEEWRHVICLWWISSVASLLHSWWWRWLLRNAFVTVSVSQITALWPAESHGRRQLILFVIAFTTVHPELTAKFVLMLSLPLVE